MLLPEFGDPKGILNMTMNKFHKYVGLLQLEMKDKDSVRRLEMTKDKNL